MSSNNYDRGVRYTFIYNDRIGHPQSAEDGIAVRVFEESERYMFGPLLIGNDRLKQEV